MKWLREIGNKKRLFTFGCSFTKYKWNTWADILGCQFEYFENWGRAGASNHFIMNSLVECNIKNKITSADTVAVMWTNVARLDCYKNRSWFTPGNLYNKNTYAKEILDMFDTRGFYIRDLAFIYMVDQFLEKLGCEYFMFSMVDITNSLEQEAHDFSSQLTDILPHYQNVLEKIRPSMHRIVFAYDWYSRPFQTDQTALEDVKRHYQQLAGPEWPEIDQLWQKQSLEKIPRRVIKEIFNLNKWDWKKLWRSNQRTDFHPTPLEHLEYLTHVLPEYPIHATTVKMVTEADHALRHTLPCDNKLSSLIFKSPSRW